MTSLTNKQKAYLRKLGHSLKPFIHIGKLGFSPTSQTEIEETLFQHELIKLKVLPNAPINAKDSISELPALFSCTVVQQIGHMLLIYKPNPKKPKIILPD